jgi:hypothetical protein
MFSVCGAVALERWLKRHGIHAPSLRFDGVTLVWALDSNGRPNTRVLGRTCGSSSSYRRGGSFTTLGDPFPRYWGTFHSSARLDLATFPFAAGGTFGSPCVAQAALLVPLRGLDTPSGSSAGPIIFTGCGLASDLARISVLPARPIRSFVILLGLFMSWLSLYVLGRVL